MKGSHGDKISITSHGTAYAVGVLGITQEAVLTTPAELRDLWFPKFRAGGRRMLEALLKQALTKEELSEVIEMKMSGTFHTYLGELKRNGLVHVENDRLYLNEELVG